MSLKPRLTILLFLQYFIWGSWLISFGGYLGVNLHFTGTQIGLIFGTAGIAALFMPGIIGIIADRWINAERLLGICHLIAAGALLAAYHSTDFPSLYACMLVNALAFMPTVALSNSVCYSALSKHGVDAVKAFPPLRVWGTVGFIAAMWTVDLLDWTLTAKQLLMAAGASLFLGLYAFTLPPSPPLRQKQGITWRTLFGLEAIVLLRQRNVAVFFVFAVLIGICLKITNAFGTPFIQSFSRVAAYSESFVVRYSNIYLSISQISEALFILLIPFVLRRFGIKAVILMSLTAWILRFGFFAIGNPGDGLLWLTLSMIIYGLAFDFFNISGSLYVEQQAPPHLRASAQGLFMMAATGFGAVIGSYLSGRVVDYFTVDGVTAWPQVWFSFAGYALLVAVLFFLFFRKQA